MCGKVWKRAALSVFVCLVYRRADKGVKVLPFDTMVHKTPKVEKEKVSVYLTSRTITTIEGIPGTKLSTMVRDVMDRWAEAYISNDKDMEFRGFHVRV